MRPGDLVMLKCDQSQLYFVIRREIKLLNNDMYRIHDITKIGYGLKWVSEQEVDIINETG
jgi:hypothetical protein